MMSKITSSIFLMKGQPRVFPFKTLSYREFLLIILLFGAVGVSAEEEIPETLYKDGPRVGMTFITGELADKLKEEHDAEPLFSQFGWQFEQIMLAGENKSLSVVWEEIFLVGGLDQSLIVPGFTFVLGIRTSPGFEFGVGPNVLFNFAELQKDKPKIKEFVKTAVVLALGVSVPVGRFSFPIDIAFTPATTGLRFTTIMGVTW